MSVAGIASSILTTLSNSQSQSQSGQSKFQQICHGFQTARAGPAVGQPDPGPARFYYAVTEYSGFEPGQRRDQQQPRPAPRAAARPAPIHWSRPLLSWGKTCNREICRRRRRISRRPASRATECPTGYTTIRGTSPPSPPRGKLSRFLHPPRPHRSRPTRLLRRSAPLRRICRAEISRARSKRLRRCRTICSRSADSPLQIVRSNEHSGSIERRQFECFCLIGSGPQTFFEPRCRRPSGLR